MKTAIECVFKGIKEVKGGTFTNEKGQLITYNTSYKIRFDQVINNLPKECELKLSKELALNLQPLLKVYDKIVINLDVVIYDNNNISLKIISVEKK